MSFNPLIPTVNDFTLQSFGQLRANFQTINAAFASNHVGLTKDPEFSGMHNVLVTQPQGGDPTTAADEIAIYNKLITGIPQLFFAPSSSQTPIQLTYSSINADSSNTQYSFVAGPFVIYGGRINGATQGQAVVLTPATTLIYVGLIMANPQTPPLGAYSATAVNLVANTFDIQFQAGLQPQNIYYIAIGTP